MTDAATVRLTSATYMGRLLGIPYAYAMDGSQVLRTFYGFTPKHAHNRARRFLNK